MKSGQTLGQIVAKYKDAGISEKIVMRANNLATDTLSVGQKILIPGVDPLPIGLSRNPAYVEGGRSQGYAPASKSALVKGNGKYIWPTNGKVTQGFSGKHTGIDIAGKKGTAVVAIADGTVLKAFTSGWNGGYGNYVLIEHTGGIRSLYAHNSVVNVKVGDHVVAGQQIAGQGATGRVYGKTGIHSHFEIHQLSADGKTWKKINPNTLY